MAGGTSKLISVQPEELRFQFELEKQSFCDLKVSNTTKHYVAFKMKTTSPKKYFVRPNMGVIQPRDSCVIRVTLQAQRDYTADMQCKDKFLLQSTRVAPNTDVDELLPDTFNKESGKVLEECKLKVVYLSPNMSNSEDGLKRVGDNSATTPLKGKEKGKVNAYFIWTSEMDKVLGACFVEQMNQGNKLDEKCALSWIALREKLNIKVTKANIMTRLKTWEEHYDILHPVLVACNSGSAITWDYSKGRIEVHNENVWEERLKANPKLAPYRRKIVVENWDDICTLFSRDRANRQGAKANATSSISSKGTKRNLTSAQALHDVLERIADSFDKYLMTETRKATTKEVLRELEKVDLDSTQMLKALDMMMDNQRLFDTFSGMPSHLRQQWILMHLQQ